MAVAVGIQGDAMGLLDNVRQGARSLPWLLPAGATKNRLLNALGHSVDQSASVGPVFVVRVRRVELGPGARISGMSVFKDLDRVSLERGAVLSGWNLVSASRPLAQHLSDPAELVLEESAAITSRHTLDCSAPVRLEPYSILAGHGSQVLTHSIDLRHNVQSAKPITIGERSFIGTRVVLLGGSKVPSSSVVAAGSVVTPSAGDEPSSLIAGVPARRKAPVTGEWFTREHEATNAIFDPRTGETIENAF